ncbi:MAG: cytochrome c oxidase accessory protein CcoG [Bdellovibrio sp.]|nr:cytochrome c oxidase accessory protein CcoG [Bdellovibrio sp.]
MTLDPSKLTSVDEKGDRLYIIPAEVRGYYKKHRTWIHAALLAVFMLLPWTSINGLQTIWLNIPDREFALFGVLFKSHDAPLIFFLLGAATLGLAFVTSIWGRVWCGWACPQTVFIESVFRRIEQWTEGNYIERRRLREAPMDFTRIRKQGTKWFLFVVASLIIAHSFMAYFIGAKNIVAMMQLPPSENFTYFLLVMAFTAAILFDFAWFREQFCVIMCPYGRIQSLLLDSKSKAVLYDVKRGEPRKGTAPAEKVGDCVACNRCVQVCPTGIDIRNGLQMECIGCTACIDACDEIMAKVKKPQGLIRYDTLDGSKMKLTRPRSMAYMITIGIMIAGLSYAVVTREPFHWTPLRGAGLPYSYVKDESGVEVISNQFKIHIQNQERQEATYKLSLPQDILDRGVRLTVGENPLTLKSEEGHEWYFFVRIPQDLFKGQKGKIKTRVQIETTKDGAPLHSEKELILLGPGDL